MNKQYVMPPQGKINQWKKDYGKVVKLVTKVPGEDDAICIVRYPNLNDISMSAQLGENDQFKTGKIQFDNCFLDGDDRIKTRLSILQSMVFQIAKIFKVYSFDVTRVPLDQEMISALKPEKIAPERMDKILAEGAVRKIVVLFGDKPVGAEKDKREALVGFFQCPDLEIKEKAQMASNFLDQGATYVQECFLFGDQRLLSGDDETRFASYCAGNHLLETFTTSIEKL